MQEQQDLLYLEEIANSLRDAYKFLCMYVLRDERFRVAPGSSSHHHAHPHGLLEHTADVVQRCEHNRSIHLDWNVLATAAIWHDYHKIHEYEMWKDEKTHEWAIQSKPWAKLIGHIVGGYCEFVQVAERYTLADSKVAAIGHCILAHHGRFEWGSPVEPNTDEAFLLHSMDMRSVQEWNAAIKSERLQQSRQIPPFIQAQPHQEHSKTAV